MKKIPSKSIVESTDGNYEFSCLMLDIPSPFSDFVSKWGETYIDEGDLYIDHDNFIEGLEDTPHVTVKYGIHSPDKECVSEYIKSINDITIRLGNISKFESDDFDVLHIEVDSDDLVNLNKEITENIECTDTFPEYIPHCTLAYVKKGSCDDMLDDDFFNGFSVSNDELVFSSLDGSEHKLEL
jgi:hypothetical protein